MARDIDAEPLTEQELLDLVAGSPRLMRTITDADPRVKLHELLYQNKEFREVIEEMGVKVAPDSHLARARRHARAEIEPLVGEVKKLHKELTERKGEQDTQAFYDGLRRYANEEGAELLKGEVEEIVAFMKDNEYGPKAAKAAVVAWLETKAPAEPTFEPAKAFTFADDEHAKALDKLGPADDLGPSTPRGIAHAERVWHSMFGKDRKFQSPAFAQTA